MRLEEILPEIRKGRKARRPHWHEDIAVTYKLDFVSLSGGSVIVQEQKFSRGELLANDWELVPEKRKHCCWLGLFEDGDSISSETEARVYEYARLNAENMKPLKSAKLVEVRKIEWEVDG